MPVKNGIEKINYGVLIPTYNNDKTLEQVILSVLEITSNVIVVNDGSTDNTANILENFKNKIDIVSYPNNQGKGAALRKGFRRAEELRYEFVVAIDSDGQHFPADIPKLLEKVRPGENILVIGHRDMTAANIPPKSIFGRKFSNFWVKLETNQDLMDTQSGFRLYTVVPMNRFHFFTVRYDFELESLVRWVWHDYPVAIATVNVHYPPPEERVSHFKGLKDNFRISLLNTALVTVTVIYILPRRFFRTLIQGIQKIIRER
jgi:glycosyltransferase involved in cell wall biosynthesis